MNWLDRIPLGILVAMTVLMALAPFSPQPHLWEKLDMLIHGTLQRPIDIFDLFWHLLPAMLLIAKLRRRSGQGGDA